MLSPFNPNQNIFFKDSFVIFLILKGRLITQPLGVTQTPTATWWCLYVCACAVHKYARFMVTLNLHPHLNHGTAFYFTVISQFGQQALYYIKFQLFKVLFFINNREKHCLYSYCSSIPLCRLLEIKLKSMSNIKVCATLEQFLSQNLYQLSSRQLKISISSYCLQHCILFY